MNTNARIGLAIVGFFVIAGIAIFACAERGTESKGRSEKSGRRRHRKQPENSPDSPMEQDKVSEQIGADKGQGIETP